LENSRKTIFLHTVKIPHNFGLLSIQNLKILIYLYVALH